MKKSLLNTQTRKIPPILDHQSANLEESLFIAGGPRKIHFNTFPSLNPYFIGNYDWMDLLVIHEGRHACNLIYCITM